MNTEPTGSSTMTIQSGILTAYQVLASGKPTGLERFAAATLAMTASKQAKPA